MWRPIAALAVLFVLILACDNYSWGPVDPTVIKPNDLAGKDFSHTDLEGLDLSGKNFRGAKFRGANLRDAKFSGCDLRNADFTDASLAHTNFSGADLRGAKLEGAWLWGTDFTSAKLDEKWARLAYLVKSENGQGGNFSGYDLSNVVFDSHLNLEGANLQGTNLVVCQESYSLCE